MKSDTKRIPESTVRRLSLYHRLLLELGGLGRDSVSSRELAERGGTTSAQVRKDLSLFGSFGKRGYGYDVADLAARIADILGLSREWRVGVVGAGKIGAALASYGEFPQDGFPVVALFDADPGKIGQAIANYTVRSMDDLESTIQSEQIDMLIIAIPSDVAQSVVDRGVAAGVVGFLNFAATKVHVPAGVAVRTVNMVLELEGLSYALAHR